MKQLITFVLAILTISFVSVTPAHAGAVKSTVNASPKTVAKASAKGLKKSVEFGAKTVTYPFAHPKKTGHALVKAIF